MSATLPPSDARVARLVAWYEGLSEHRLGEIDDLYRADAAFKDPFNDVSGTPAIRRVFEHMFASLQGPRFTVVDAVCEGDACLLVWNFDFRREGGAAMRIHGASHITFADDGRVARHRDYWDAAEELYEKLPLIGSLMRALRRRLQAR
jgi:steroid Delta-isomerase